MEDLYVQQAVKAFNDGEYRKCLAFLQNIKSWDQQKVQLLVQSSYFHWKVASENKTITNYDGALDLAHKAFSRLLNGGVPYELISANDYMMIIHIYLSEGNMSSALMIANLASARGYLEDILVVVQSYLILKRLDKSAELERYYEFIVSKLLIISSTLTGNSKLNSGDIDYVLCAIFLYFTNQLCVSINLVTRNKRLPPNRKILLLQTFCGSAFHIYTGKICNDLRFLLDWFQEKDIWQFVGHKLRSGPFILLAEELYWVCFCRSTLDELCISLVYDCMVETNRLESLPSLLARAFSIAPWNLFVRDKLFQWAISSADVVGMKWVALLESQLLSVLTVQRVFRGYCLRKNWHALANKLREIRDEFYRKLFVSDEMFANHQHELLRQLFFSWKVNVHNLKSTKQMSAIRLQAMFRSSSARFSYAKKKEMIAGANLNFLILSLMGYARLRFKYFHKWFDCYHEKRKRHAAQTISDVLIANGYNQLLVKGMSVLLALLRIHKIHETQRQFKQWLKRYEIARKRHAIATIRFFVRGCLLRAAEKAIEQELVKLEYDVALRRTTDFRANYLPLLRQMWSHWKALFNKIRNFRGRCKMVLSIQTRFRRYKARQALKSKFLRVECQMSFLWFTRIKKLSIIFRFWRCLRSTRVIQRSFRCYCALQRYRKVVAKQNRIRSHHDTKLFSMKKTVWCRWIRYVYICKKEHTRNYRMMRNLWFWWKHFARLAAAVARKYYVLVLCEKIHKFSLRFAFRRLCRGAMFCQAHCSLKNAILLLTQYNIRRAFRKFKIQSTLQALLWLRTKKSTLINRKMLLTSSYFRIWISFKRWQCAQRLSFERRLSVARDIAKLAWKNSLTSLNLRSNNAVKIQAVSRGRQGRIKADALLQRRRMINEFLNVSALKNLLSVWIKWRTARDSRMKARSTINNRFIKYVKFRFRAIKQLERSQEYDLKADFVEVSPKFHLSLLMKAFQSWIISFLASSPTKHFDGATNSVGQVCKQYLRGEKRYNRFKKIVQPSMTNFEFRSEMFHATLQSTLRTKCLIYDRSADMSQNEIAACIQHADSLFISSIDLPIIEASKYFHGKKIVIHDCEANTMFVALIGSILLQPIELEMPPSLPDSKLPPVQIQIIGIARHIKIFLQFMSIMCTTHQAKFSHRREIEELQFNTQSMGYLAALKLLWVAKEIPSLKKLRIWKDCNAPFPLLHTALVALSRSQSLEELRMHGPFDLNQACFEALKQGLSEGFTKLRILEVSSSLTTVKISEDIINQAKILASHGKFISIVFS